MTSESRSRFPMIPNALLGIMRFGGFACLLSFPPGDRFPGTCRSRHSRTLLSVSQAHLCCAIPQTRAWRPARGRWSQLASRQRQDAHRPSSASRTGEQSYTHLKATELGSGTGRAPHGSRSEPGALSTPAFLLQLPNSRFQTPKSPPLKTHLHLVSPAL